MTEVHEDIKDKQLHFFAEVAAVSAWYGAVTGAGYVSPFTPKPLGDRGWRLSWAYYPGEQSPAELKKFKSISFEFVPILDPDRPDGHWLFLVEAKAYARAGEVLASASQPSVCATQSSLRTAVTAALYQLARGDGDGGEECLES
jgi:hypothetical protein